MPKPLLATVPQWYHRYIEQVENEELSSALDKNTKMLFPFLASIPEDKWEYRYAEGKWTIKEMVLHMSDTERIFCYRSLVFARQDKTALPGFEENDYAAASQANKRTKENLMTEYQSVRAAAITLFKSFDEEQLDRIGTANNNPIAVNAIGYILVGHALHHLQILKERYL